MKKNTATKRKRPSSPVDSFVDEVDRKFRTGDASEASYYPAIQDLVEAVALGSEAISQPKRIACGAPDFVVLKGGAPRGYIEAKDIGADLAQAERSDQLVRYRTNLANLLLTNGIEWRWYVDGELRKIVEIGESKFRRINFDESTFGSLLQLVDDFSRHEFESIQTSKILAVRLASATRTIKFLIERAFELKDEDTKWLERWFKSFQQVLLDDLTIDRFADMFAQTLAYGMFAARMNTSEGLSFSRINAAHVLPKTNPFLRKLFAEFTGVSMPDVISWAVDDLVELLRRTDIASINAEFANIEGKEDSIVHFYESFLKEYDPSLRQRRGVFYTPKQIVDFIIRSVDELLISKFSKQSGLADEGVLILDPAVGTGSFLNSAVDLIYSKFTKNRGMWDSYVSETLLKRIYGFEILMAPYTVSHLKIGMKLKDTGHTFGSKERLGIFLTNTLEAAAKKSEQLMWVADEANAAASVKQEMPIMVVVGNPPYKGHSANKGEWIEGLLKGFDSLSRDKCSSYFHSGCKPLKERQLKWLHDDYVKFFRFAQWRVERTGSGIVAMITNHAFLENPTFRGMRESLLTAFDEIYVIDLHGNSKRKEAESSGVKDQNVFEITQGVSITFLIKRDNKRVERFGKLYRGDVWGSRKEKYEVLESHSMSSMEMDEIVPSEPLFLFSKTANEPELSQYQKYPCITDIFDVHGVGIVAGRDALAIDFSEKEMRKKVARFAELTPEKARKEFGLGDDARDWKVQTARDDVQTSGVSKRRFQRIMYRPFDYRYTYYTGQIKGFHCQPARKIMDHLVDDRNLAICVAKRVESGEWSHVFCADALLGLHSVSSKESNYVFPLKRFNECRDGQKTLFAADDFDWNIKPDFQRRVERLYAQRVGIEEIFSYVYAVLNSSMYREQYSQPLRSGFPRIPLVQERANWKKLAKMGMSLIEIHTLKSVSVEDSPASFPHVGSGHVELVEFDAKSKSVSINASQRFEGLSSGIWSFEVGRYKVCEKWLKDRKGRILKADDVAVFLKIVAAVAATITLQKEVDKVYSKSTFMTIKG